jgi:hypothetical protein
MFKDFNTRTYEKALAPFLNQGEQVIACGSFETRPSLAAKVLTLGIASVTNQVNVIGVTNDRIIVIPYSRTKFKPSGKDAFSVSYDEVVINKNNLAIHKPGANKPSKYFFRFGLKSLSGIDKDEFIAAIEQRKRK